MESTTTIMWLHTPDPLNGTRTYAEVLLLTQRRRQRSDQCCWHLIFCLLVTQTGSGPRNTNADFTLSKPFRPQRGVPYYAPRHGSRGNGFCRRPPPVGLGPTTLLDLQELGASVRSPSRHTWVVFDGANRPSVATAREQRPEGPESTLLLSLG
jgi:hypothetical protein